MDEAKFKSIYHESRNGCNEFFRHPLARSVAYTDGVRDLADTGCHWMLDIFSTELPAIMRANEDVSSRCIIKAVVKDGRVLLSATFDDDQPAPWVRRIAHTDLPEGEWVFMMADEGEGPTPYRILMLSEY